MSGIFNRFHYVLFVIRIGEGITNKSPQLWCYYFIIYQVRGLARDTAFFCEMPGGMECVF